MDVTVTVKNTGKVAGKEVVHYTFCTFKNIDKPSSELKAFGKTYRLQAGESQTISFIIDLKDLASTIKLQEAIKAYGD
jgi:beta-glucosidase